MECELRSVLTTSRGTGTGFAIGLRHFFFSCREGQRAQPGGWIEVIVWLVGLLNLVDAELSPLRYRQGPRSEEEEEEEGLCTALQCHQQNDSCIKTGSPFTEIL